MTRSFEYFKKLLFTHAVDRPPLFVKIFSERDVEFITEFMLNGYFRHFKLYKYIFTKKLKVTLVQRTPNQVEIPPRPRSLGEALPLENKSRVGPPLP